MLINCSDKELLEENLSQVSNFCLFSTGSTSNIGKVRENNICSSTLYDVDMKKNQFNLNKFFDEEIEVLNASDFENIYDLDEDENQSRGDLIRIAILREFFHIFVNEKLNALLKVVRNSRGFPSFIDKMKKTGGFGNVIGIYESSIFGKLCQKIVKNINIQDVKNMLKKNVFQIYDEDTNNKSINSILINLLRDKGENEVKNFIFKTFKNVFDDYLNFKYDDNIDKEIYSKKFLNRKEIAQSFILFYKNSEPRKKKMKHPPDGKKKIFAVELNSQFKIIRHKQIFSTKNSARTLPKTKISRKIFFVEIQKSS